MNAAKTTPFGERNVGCQSELIEVIKTRRAVREYMDARVDRWTVERLLDAAVLAPSAMNLQPWAFAVLLDRERINNYARRAKDWLLANDSQVGTSAFYVLHVNLLSRDSRPVAGENKVQVCPNWYLHCSS